MAVTLRNGKWWVDLTLPDGQRIRRVSPVQSKRGAHEFEAQLLSSGSSTSTPCSSAGEAKRPPSRVPTLKAFAPEWLTTYAVVNNRRSEVVGKECALRLHLLPFFGNLPLDEIGARDIEHYKAEKLRRVDGERPLSPKSINNHLTILRKVLSTAREWGLISEVPVIRLLRLPTHTFDWLTREEAKTFLAAIDEHYPQWKALFYLALRTGMRRGEIFALRWVDLDLDTAKVHVRHSVYRGRLEAPKSGRSRTIPLTPQLVAILRERKASRTVESDFVFPSAEGGLTTHQDHVDRPLVGALEAAGLRMVRFHDLRHSFASQLVSAGRSIKEAQELLGHASLTMTLRYAHLAPEQMRDAVSVLDD